MFMAKVIEPGGLRTAVAHLNASVGPCLTVEQLAAALRAGSVAAISDSPTAAALASHLFSEVEPALIALCAHEAGSDVAHANMLYQESLLSLMPRVPPCVRLFVAP